MGNSRSFGLALVLAGLVGGEGKFGGALGPSLILPC
jgi:hypothetical protein